MYTVISTNCSMRSCNLIISLNAKIQLLIRTLNVLLTQSHRQESRHHSLYRICRMKTKESLTLSNVMPPSQAMSGMSSTIPIGLAIVSEACTIWYLSQQVRYLMQRNQVSTGHAEPNFNLDTFPALIHSRTDRSKNPMSPLKYQHSRVRFLKAIGGLNAARRNGE